MKFSVVLQEGKVSSLAVFHQCPTTFQQCPKCPWSHRRETGVRGIRGPGTGPDFITDQPSDFPLTYRIKTLDQLR